MKYKSIILVLALSLTSLFVSAHDYHTSITDVSYNPRTKSLEVAVKVFTDDLEDALSRRNKRKITYSKSGEVQRFLADYLQSSLTFEVAQGKPLKHTFVGAEEDADVIWAYVEVPLQATALSQLYVRNAVLTELFSDQMNIVNINYKGKVNSTLFQKDDGVKKISF
ncbi:DUF6702 family protein [Pontibacter ruber]|uniref:DUF6702 family protein n=1 Tax=Pontibacter ruber TaxID=1343895 RepID=A0ABW5CXF6_9BACT|nr:DUF6702 family protein [Pontibacter ruber]